jgi:hypothetical protein
MKTFPIEVVCDEPVVVRLKRFDGLFYNVETKKFEDNPELNLPLVNGQNFEVDVWRATPDIEASPEEFLPGRYTVYYYDRTNVLRGASTKVWEVETSIAERLASIQTIDGSLRQTLNKVSRQLDEILGILKTNNTSLMDGSRVSMNPPT